MPAASRPSNLRVAKTLAPRAPIRGQNRRPPPPAPPPSGPAPALAPESLRRPLVRIRSLLFLAAVIALAVGIRPHAQAAWKLQGAATNLADYALCMAGPTGPALLRDGSPTFKMLVRRRLLAAEANERPFQDCAKLAEDLTASSEIADAHRATAWSFVEYGGAAADRAAAGSRGERSLDALAVSAHGLGELAAEAWPFVRQGWVKLVKPSLSAKEAMHPVELPRPGIGRGLPQWRAGYRAVGEVDGALTLALGRAANLSVFKSTDGGLCWQPAPVRGVERFAERCPAGDRWYTFSLSDDSKNLLVTSQSPEAPPHTVPAAKPDVEIVGVSCDDRALVAALRTPGSRDVALVSCTFRGNCHPLPPPRFAGVGAVPGFPLDVARVQGVTIVATAMHGIARVASTRDDGQSWTPFTVAYDDGANPDLRVDVRVPTRLLVIGKRVWLHGGAPKPGQTYTALVSDDYGASFRTPEAAPTAVGLAR
jgi:hypothetical protein